MRGIDIMRQHLGQQEVRDKSILMHWFEQNAHNKDICIDPAVTSWCAASMNAAEREAGYPGSGQLNAQSFKVYGQEVTDWDMAQEGDILVFHFPFDKPWQGH